MAINKCFKGIPGIETLVWLGFLVLLVALVWLVTPVKKNLPCCGDCTDYSGKTRGFRVRFPVGPPGGRPCESELAPESWTGLILGD